MLDLNIQNTADEMIESGEIKPLIIVAPRLENSRGVNSSLKSREVISPGDSGIIINTGMYEDYFIKEIIPLIDNKFNTIKTRVGRYIEGISSGGYAALHIAFNHDEMFCKAEGHMSAIELTLLYLQYKSK